MWMGGLTQCLINLFSSVLGGYTSHLWIIVAIFLVKIVVLLELPFCFNDKIQSISFGCEVDFC